MSYRLYLDDLLTPVDESFVVVRSFDEATRFEEVSKTII